MACFTRPENKVERVSYPVPTPSAARGMLEAIFWKPEFQYRVREIAVLQPVKFASILRNEVDGKATGADGLSITDRRQQRHTLLLKDVAYVVRADIVLKPHATDDVAKYREQFRRRVARGQCFQRPYFGCREFAADFAEPDGAETPVADRRDLGLMLFDIGFAKTSSTPLFFEARLEQGILRVPDAMYGTLEAIA
jgi:CRISPR-associated protein Cas5d